MDTQDESVSSTSTPSSAGLGRPDEYYEELDGGTLNLQRRKAPPTPIPTTIVAREPTVIIDPVQRLNEQLNRKFRPDLVPPTPLVPQPETTFVPPAPPRIVSPDPVIYDARAKPIKSPPKEKAPSISVRQKIFNRLHQLTALTPTPASPMPDQETSFGSHQVPPGMMLVPIPSYRQPSVPNVSQPVYYPSASQYQPSAVIHANSFKHNRVAPPPLPVNPYSTHLPNNSFVTPSSLLSTNPLVPTSYQSRPQDQSTSKHNSKAKHSHQPDRSFALYNQKNGRIEGVVKNRLNVVANDSGDGKLTDEDAEQKGKWALWCSQPLCMGLTRLSGGILFGSMAFLGVASIAGLIASIVTYTQDSTTDAQWKILGMVVCAIMLITIIVTLLIFICCYKNGYMFNQDDEDDPGDPSTTRDAEGNDRQKAVLRKIYKFNRPSESPSVMMQNSITPAPPPVQPRTVHITDKQTNTEETIAPTRPRDFDRGVWTYVNAFGGKSYRPLVAPPMTSRFIQVFPHEIEAAYPQPQIIYQMVAPAAHSPLPEPRRMIKIPAPQAPVIEVIEQPVKAPRTKIIRQAPAAPAAARFEYVEVEEPRGHRVVQRPQYQVVEDVYGDSSSESSMEEYVEIVDEPKPRRHHRHGRKKGKRQEVGKISVKHVRATD